MSEFDTGFQPNMAGNFGVPFLRALGISTYNVIGFTVTCDATNDELPVLHIKRFLSYEDGKVLHELLQQFEIVNRAEDQSTPVDEAAGLMRRTPIRRRQQE